MNSRESFNKLLEHLKQVSKFNYAAALMGWDLRTYMPKGGAQGRAEIIGAVETEGFKLFISDSTEYLLSELLPALNEFDSEEQAFIKVIDRVYQRSRKIPPELFEKFSVLKSKADGIWREAKAKSDFTIFCSTLEQIIGITKQFANLYGYEKNPYDALLPSYEPGITTDEINSIVVSLREKIVPFFHKLMESLSKPNDKILYGDFEPAKQEKLLLEILERIGFNFSEGRLDVTEHPFETSVGPNDCRLTVKYHPDNFAPALFGAIHETGHGLFEQGKSNLLKWLSIDGSYSLGLHESQSRMWENLVGRSLPFWKFFYPKLQGTFPDFKGIPLRDFYCSINVAKRSPIRIHADEVSYNLHIMLRFEIEVALLKGEIKIKDLPVLWNEKMQEYIGITPKNDAEGVLQDMHWSMGAFGYFPTYMLGNLIASQLFTKVKYEIPNLEEEFFSGNFHSLLSWLRTHIHPYGLIHTASEFLENITGEKLNPQYWISYIEEKFSDIYDI